MIGMFDTPELGYIKLHRRIGQNAIWENSNLLKVWLWCLLKAHWKNGYSQIFRGSKREIKRGQFLTGTIKGARECNLSRSTFYRALKKLEQFETICIESETKKTLVTVLNYESYQGSGGEDETKAEHKRNTSGTQADTDEEVKKERRKEVREGKPNNQEVTTEYFLTISGNDEDAKRFYDHFESNGWRVGGKAPMKDWRAAARNWMRNKKGFINAGTGTSGRPNSQIERARFSHNEQAVENLVSLEESLRERRRERRERS